MARRRDADGAAAAAAAAAEEQAAHEASAAAREEAWRAEVRPTVAGFIWLMTERGSKGERLFERLRWNAPVWLAEVAAEIARSSEELSATRDALGGRIARSDAARAAAERDGAAGEARADAAEARRSETEERAAVTS